MTGPRTGRGPRRDGRGGRRTGFCLALLALALFPRWMQAGEPYTARTHTFEAVETGKGPVKLLWDGEIVNDTVEPATLCAVLVVKDSGGRVLAELRSASVNVERFGRARRSEVFEVAPEVWGRADVVEERAAPSAQKPVDGERIRQVELYTTSWCPWCQKAKAYLDAKGVSFVEHDVERDPGAANAKERLAPGKGVPVLVVDGKVSVGFSEGSFDRLLRDEKEVGR